MSACAGDSGVCGDGVIEANEACDGIDFAGETCSSQGFGGGDLLCSARCTIITTSCSANNEVVDDAAAAEQVQEIADLIETSADSTESEIVRDYSNGLLAGTWALRLETWSESNVGIGGWRLGGSEFYYLVERNWSDIENKYTQSTKMCGGELYKTDDIDWDTYLDQSTYDTVPTLNLEQVEFVDDRLRVRDFVELWGITLDDPLNGTFPSSQSAAQSHPGVYDQENDGHWGVTNYSRGAPWPYQSLDSYYIQRRILAWESSSISLDRIDGVITLNDNIIKILEVDGAPDTDPERRASSVPQVFNEIRLSRGANCSDVLAINNWQP